MGSALTAYKGTEVHNFTGYNHTVIYTVMYIHCCKSELHQKETLYNFMHTTIIDAIYICLHILLLLSVIDRSAQCIQILTEVTNNE